MPRVVSFIVLVAIILLVGSMFFKVMVQFIVPLFLAAVLVVIFGPLYQWFLRKCSGRHQLAAGLTTVMIVFIVLLPLAGLLIRAISDGARMYDQFNNQQSVAEVEFNSQLVTKVETDQDSIEDVAKSEEAEADVAEPSKNALHSFLDKLIVAVDGWLTKLNLPTLEAEHVHSYVDGMLSQIAAPLALGGVQALVGSLVGLAIMVLALYYFFADGPSMIATLMRLSPLDDAYERELLDKFGDISRAVVIATLLSAIVQGVLAGVGYFFVGIEQVFFLTALTMFLAMVPFIGAAAVWAPVCAWIYFAELRALPAAILAIYCVIVVSMVDNVIKPIVLHGRSNLHPLLALLSVVGGVQALGPIGILVGPMLVALLQALLVMLNKELHLLGNGNSEPAVAISQTTSISAVAHESLPSESSSPKKSQQAKRGGSKRKQKRKK